VQQEPEDQPEGPGQQTGGVLLEVARVAEAEGREWEVADGVTYHRCFVSCRRSEEDPDPSPVPVSKRPGITGEAKSQPKKRAPAKKEPTAKKGSVAKKQNNKPNKPAKVRQVSRSCMQMNHVQHAETDGSEGRSDLRVRV
jgi:hypothetical protein